MCCCCCFRFLSSFSCFSRIILTISSSPPPTLFFIRLEDLWIFFIFSSHFFSSSLNLFNCRLKNDIYFEAASTRTSKQTIHTTVLAAILRVKLWKLSEWHSRAHTHTHTVKSNGIFVQWNKTTKKKLHLDNLKSRAKLKRKQRAVCVRIHSFTSIQSGKTQCNWINKKIPIQITHNIQTTFATNSSEKQQQQPSTHPPTR